MGAIDVSGKAFFSNRRNFADLINGVVFGGRTVVFPADLEDMETERLNESEGNSCYVDISKRWKSNHLSSHFRLTVIVLENQDYIDYGMVIRNMTSEVLEYRKQLKDIKAYHHKEKDIREDEFLSGISKNDMLQPVITIVVYLGDKAWDGPRQLYDMLDMDENLKSYVYNYQLNLLDYHEIKDDMSFSGEVAILLNALRVKGNEQETNQFIRRNRYLKKTTGKLVGELLNIDLSETHTIKTLKGDRMDMCKAWDDHYNSGVKEGIEKGIKEGIKEGIEKGFEQGKKKVIEILISAGKISREEAIELLGQISENESDILTKKS